MKISVLISCLLVLGGCVPLAPTKTVHFRDMSNCDPTVREDCYTIGEELLFDILTKANERDNFEETLKVCRKRL